MIESKLRPNLAVYNKLIEGLVKVGKVDEAKSFFDMMVNKLRMDDDSYKFMMNALFEVGKHGEVLETIGKMLREEPSDFTPELEEYVREVLRKEGREEELTKLKEDVEREKAEAAAREAEAAERAKASARAAVSSLIPSRLFGNKESEAASENASALMGAGEGKDLQDGNAEEEPEKGTNLHNVEEESEEGANLQAAEAKSDEPHPQEQAAA